MRLVNFNSNFYWPLGIIIIYLSRLLFGSYVRSLTSQLAQRLLARASSKLTHKFLLCNEICACDKHSSSWLNKPVVTFDYLYMFSSFGFIDNDNNNNLLISMNSKCFAVDRYTYLDSAIMADACSKSCD